MRKSIILVTVLLLAVLFLLPLCACTGNPDSQSLTDAYKTGYEAGYTQGREASRIEADNLLKRGYAGGYAAGYEKGVDECTRLSGPKDELVKVLSYNLVRDSSLGWVKVVGELENLSSRQLFVTVSGALLNSNGEIISTDRTSLHVEPQQRAFFTLGSFYQQPEAVDARLTVAWN